MAIDYNNPGEKALSRWKLVAEEYLRNGYNQTKAYMAIYPDAKANSASAAAPLIFSSPPIKEYIKMRRQEIYDAMCLDTQHLATEIATIAFEHDTEQVSIKDRLKALEILYKASREDEKISNNNAELEIKIRVEDDDNNFI